MAVTKEWWCCCVAGSKEGESNWIDDVVQPSGGKQNENKHMGGERAIKNVPKLRWHHRCEKKMFERPVSDCLRPGFRSAGYL